MDRNEKKLKKIAEYFRQVGLTSFDEADLLAEYEDILTFEEIAKICNILLTMERKERDENDII